MHPSVSSQVRTIRNPFVALHSSSLFGVAFTEPRAQLPKIQDRHQIKKNSLRGPTAEPAVMKKVFSYTRFIAASVIAFAVAACINGLLRWRDGRILADQSTHFFRHLGVNDACHLNDVSATIILDVYNPSSTLWEFDVENIHIYVEGDDVLPFTRVNDIGKFSLEPRSNVSLHFEPSLKINEALLASTVLPKWSTIQSIHVKSFIWVSLRPLWIPVWIPYLHTMEVDVGKWGRADGNQSISQYLKDYRMDNVEFMASKKDDDLCARIHLGYKLHRLPLSSEIVVPPLAIQLELEDKDSRKSNIFAHIIVGFHHLSANIHGGQWSNLVMDIVLLNENQDTLVGALQNIRSLREMTVVSRIMRHPNSSCTIGRPRTSL